LTTRRTFHCGTKMPLGTIPIPFVEQTHVFHTRHAHPIGWQATNLTWSCICLLDNSIEVLLVMFHRYAEQNNLEN
jgi:hypothetical protein